MKKLLIKAAKKSLEFFATARLLTCSVQLPKDQAAIDYLRKIAPDTGRSCCINRDSNYSQRSIQLSVIVPVYNSEKYIARCLNSILQQQVSFDYEIIVVDDGSTDRTSEILRLFAQEKKVRIIYQDNQGASGARNAAIRCSKGEYICFVDSDDELPAETLESMMKAAVENKGLLIAGSIEKCKSNGVRQYVIKLNNKKLENERLPGFACGKMIHYSIFQKLQFPENYWFEDSIMAQIVHPMCRNATYMISPICYRYFSNEEGNTSLAKGRLKSVDSLWITMKLLRERAEFSLEYTQADYEYFLSMVKLTYRRTKYLNPRIAQSIFVVQRKLMRCYYAGYTVEGDIKKQRIQEALKSNQFKKYIIACEGKD